MSLKIIGWKKIVSRTLWALLILIVAVFFFRVLIFEHQYYNEKEGSLRATTVEVSSETEEEIIEVKPTETEVEEYTVAADLPRYLIIEKLGIKARVIKVGVTADNQLDTPSNIYDVGWYDASSKPGEGGTLLMDAHSGGRYQYGVFNDLPSLVAGDIIKVERGDGQIFQYKVVENNQIPLDDADAYMKTAMKSPESGKESITLITCSGDWSSQRNTFLSRQFVRAVIVE